MENQYIVKVNAEKFLCFYFKNNTIFVKEIIGGKISSEKVIANNVRGNYTVTLCKNRMVYLFCQSLSGDIIHFKIKNDTWNKNIILKNNGKNSKNILFYCIENGSQMSLIYNIPMAEAPNSPNSFDIMKQTFDGKENWSAPEKIDSILSTSDFIFQIYIISPGHGVVFYQKNMGNSENNIGYREFNIDGIGKYTSVYATKYRITATSFLPAENGIHFIFAVKNIFSTRIIYRKKGMSGINDYIILSETNQVESCEISIIKDSVYAFWKTPMGMFYCISKDNGNTFSKAYKYSKKITGPLKKASYLSFEEMSENKFYVNSLYTNQNDIWDIKILPDIYDNFITETNSKNSEKNALPPIPQFESVKNAEETFNKEATIIKEYKNSINTSDKFNTTIEVLNNKINMLNEQLIFKNKQIEQLTASLQRKNEEILLNEKVWRKKYKDAVNSTNEKNKGENSFSKNNNISTNNTSTENITLAETNTSTEDTSTKNSTTPENNTTIENENDITLEQTIENNTLNLKNPDNNDINNDNSL